MTNPQFFYKNGVPKWRGTGYYYSRYRPTLSHTLIFLALLTSLLHLLVMNLNYNRDRKRVEYFERSAKNAAGVGLVNKIAENGGNITPVTNGANITEGRRRKVKVAMVEGSEYGGQLELIVQGEEVYIVSNCKTPFGAVTFRSTSLTCSRTMMALSNLYRVWLLLPHTSVHGHSY